MKIPNVFGNEGIDDISLARIVSEDSQHGGKRNKRGNKSSKDS